MRVLAQGHDQTTLCLWTVFLEVILFPPDKGGGKRDDLWRTRLRNYHTRYFASFASSTVTPSPGPSGTRIRPFSMTCGDVRMSDSSP
jgi:hypothetical protein